MGIGMTELLVIMVIVILVFGTKRLKSVGSDLGDAIKSFRTAMKDGSEAQKPEEKTGETLEADVSTKEKDQA